METPNNIALSPETLVSEMQTPPAKVIDAINNHIRKTVTNDGKGKLFAVIQSSSLSTITGFEYSYTIYGNWLKILANMYRENGWTAVVKYNPFDCACDRLELTYQVKKQDGE